MLRSDPLITPAQPITGALARGPWHASRAPATYADTQERTGAPGTALRVFAASALSSLPARLAGPEPVRVTHAGAIGYHDDMGCFAAMNIRAAA